MATWQFVADMASTTPAVLLDLHSGNPFLVGLAGLDMSPSKYDKGWVSSPLRHGSRSTRSAAQNIVLKIPLEIRAQTETVAATAIESLGLQLSVDNILKVQVGSANPVFYRTFGDPDYAMVVRTSLLKETRLELEITAEPFAYGPRVEVSGSPFTVSNDPAAVTNPCRFDITGVLGDVPTPLLILATSTGATNGLVSKRTHFSVRRRGTPSGYANVIQGESMTQGTDTSAGADAAMSNGNRARITFATNTTYTPVRLSDTFPGDGVATVEARGEYIVYARVARTTTTGTINMKLGYGASSAAPIYNTAVTPTVATTSAMWINLGKVPVPVFSDPVEHGYSGTTLKALMAFVGIYAERLSGTGNLDVDCLYFMPADDQTVIVDWPSTDTTYALDGTTAAGGSAYAMPSTLDEVITTAAPPAIIGGGGFPEVIPGATNRIHFLRQVNPAVTDGITNTTTIRAYYWPRWREYGRS